MFNGTLRINLIHCKDLPKKDLVGSSDPYVICEITGPYKTKVKSKIMKNNLNPIFNEFLDIEIKELRDSILDEIKLIINVYDEDSLNKDDLIGKVSINNIKEMIYN